MTRGPISEVLDVREAATLLNAHVETVRRLARRGEIPSFKVGKDWRFRRDALLRWSDKAPGENAAEETRTPKRNRKAQSADGMPTASRRSGVVSFPIVGIGASAGGLEALELFLRHVPEKSGLALVVVQHLDPTRKGMMVELLQRATTMKVVQIKDRMRVEPDCVYVIPSNKDLSLLHGVLHLLEPMAPRGLRLPIDFFFRSLAADQRDRSVGVILSGMGSDGTLGLRAIKEQAGAVFVQAPDSAKFNAMPRSAIDAGLADVVAPVEKLPGRIVAFRARTVQAAQHDLPLASATQSALEKVFVLLRSQTGHDFSLYKRSTVYRRIERRMGLHQIDTLAGYLRYVQESPQEAQLLFKELLIGVTSFFRDPIAWEHLQTKAIPALLAERPAGGVLRAWVPGCSTGEEAYSLAIAFKEALTQQRPAERYTLQVFATDLDKDAIDRARQGTYALNIASDVSSERLRRFFVKENQSYRVGQEIRETVIFAPQNLIMDPPFTKLDILSCRNLLIYLAPELQRKLLPLFHYSLNPGGVLFLGNAETIGASHDLFAPMGSKTRTYRRLDTAVRTDPVEFPAAFHPRPSTGPSKTAARTGAPNLQTLADQLLLTRYSPAAVLTNNQGDILYVGGRTGAYLEPAAGKANWNIHAMARAELRTELSGGFQRALRERRTVTPADIKLGSGGTAQVVGLTIEPLQEPEALSGMVMITFSERRAPPTSRIKAKAGQAPATAKQTRELQRVRDELQTTREEMQTSQEELKSANEELQSTNEELQSTNEELTTSKEEMQSLNEELQTLNHELQAKVDDLSRVNDDMRNLLDSTDIATLFLDGDLKVRRFTAQTTRLFRLIPADLQRPITDLASDLAYPELAADAGAVLQTLVFKEKSVETVDGRWFSVRIMPYRTLDNRIDGVVITFVDTTVAKTLEATLRANQP